MWHVWGTEEVHIGDRRGAYRGVVGRPDGKVTLGRPRRCEDNIKTDVKEVGWRDMEWISVAQDREGLGGATKCGNKSAGAIKCGEFLD